MTNDDDFTQSGQSGFAVFGPLIADVASSRRTRLLDHCSTDHHAAVAHGLWSALFELLPTLSVNALRPRVSVRINEILNF